MDAQENLRRCFCWSKDEAAQFFRSVRLYPLPCRIPSFPPTNSNQPIHLGWVDGPNPLVVVRAADLPRLCVLGARAIAGAQE